MELLNKLPIDIVNKICNEYIPKYYFGFDYNDSLIRMFIEWYNENNDNDIEFQNECFNSEDEILTKLDSMLNYFLRESCFCIIEQNWTERLPTLCEMMKFYKNEKGSLDDLRLDDCDEDLYTQLIELWMISKITIENYSDD